MKTAVITGASRGLGLEVARLLCAKGYHVFLGTRHPEKTQRELESFSREGKAEVLAMDFEDPDLASELARRFRAKPGHLDVLVNNAGILPGGLGDEAGTLNAPIDDIRHALEVNTLWPLRFCQEFLPLMQQQGYGRIVNVSSGMGQLSEMGSDHPAYRISKTALNAVTRVFSHETAGKDILINSVCPGWVRTEMGGKNAPRSVEQGAAGIVWAATLETGGPTGGFFRDGKRLDW